MFGTGHKIWSGEIKISDPVEDFIESKAHAPRPPVLMNGPPYTET
jgi:hypothetical protein